jgi:hypothetical protein
MLRPQADKGENSLGFIMLDVDTRSRGTSDEFVIGAGPTNTNPTNFGKLHLYANVELWRSIFSKETPRIAKYAGRCP